MALPIEFTPEQIARIKLRYENSLTTPIAEIARDEGVSETAIQRLRRRFGWVSRNARGQQSIADSIVHEQAIAAAARAQGVTPLRESNGRFSSKAGLPGAGLPPATPRQPGCAADHAAPPAPAPETAFDAMALVRSLCVALETELTAAQKRLAAEAPVTAEASARTLASLARALSMMRALEADARKTADRTDAGHAERNGSFDDEPPLDLAELRRELVRRIDLLREDREAS